MYKPLPDSLIIQSSSVDGQGLFAKQNIEGRTNLGTTHIKLGEKIIRTPLGGFINHSNHPNCTKSHTLVTNHDDPKIKCDYKQWNLFTIKDIKKGEELTLEYSFYKI
jgi:SET domain-containing protein